MTTTSERSAHCVRCGWLVPAEGVSIDPEYDVPAAEAAPHRCEDSTCVSDAVCDAFGEIADPE